MIKDLRVVFFGNSQSALSNRFFSPLLGTPCHLVGVVDVPPAKRQSTNPWKDTGVSSFVEAAGARGTPVFEPVNPNTADFVETLAAIAPDLFLAAGYIFLLKSPLLSIPHIAAVNFHASLLPAYRGKHPVFWALRNGERQTGLSAHVMDPHFDTGDILYQVRVRTRKRDTVSTLYDRIIEKSMPVIPRLIEDAAQGTLPRHPQLEAGASYFSSVSDEDFRLDWSRTAESLRRWILISPGECWKMVGGRRIYFLDAKVLPYPGALSPGELIRMGKHSITLATSKDTLVLRRVRPEGGDFCSLSRFCAEMGLKVGDIL